MEVTHIGRLSPAVMSSQQRWLIPNACVARQVCCCHRAGSVDISPQNTESPTRLAMKRWMRAKWCSTPAKSMDSVQDSMAAKTTRLQVSTLHFRHHRFRCQSARNPPAIGRPTHGCHSVKSPRNAAQKNAESNQVPTHKNICDVNRRFISTPLPVYLGRSLSLPLRVSMRCVSYGHGRVTSSKYVKHLCTCSTHFF